MVRSGVGGRVGTVPLSGLCIVSGGLGAVDDAQIPFSSNVLDTADVQARSRMLVLEDPASKKLFESAYTNSAWRQFKV